MVEICENIAHDIRDQYTIGYTSTAERSGAYRKVRVAARTPAQGRLVVRTREGYIATLSAAGEQNAGGK